MSFPTRHGVSIYTNFRANVENGTDPLTISSNVWLLFRYGTTTIVASVPSALGAGVPGIL